MPDGQSGTNADPQAELAALRRRIAQLEGELRAIRRSEAALRESEARYRELFDNVPVGLYRSTPAGNILSANWALVRMLGYPNRESLVAANVRELYVESESREPLLEDIDRHDVALDLEFQLRRYDGTTIWVRENARAVRGDNGEVLYYEGSMEDITRHRQAEEAMRRSTEEHAALVEEQRFILDSMRDFVYRHDTEGVFYFLSKSVEDITGYTPDEWKQHYTTYLTDNPINENVVKYTEETLSTGKVQPPYLVEVRHKNGSRVMLEVCERPYFQEGKLAGIVGVARDVTDQGRPKAPD